MKIVTTIIFVLLFIFNFTFQSLSVLAHFLVTDGNIGITVHINPDDDPIIKQEAKFYLEIKDKTGQFSSEKCDCRASINKDEEVLFQTSLLNNSSDLQNSLFSYTFPQKGIYTLQVQGRSTDQSFQDFNIKYDVRVSREMGENAINTATHTHNNIFEHLGHFIIFGVGFLFILGVAIYDWVNRRIVKTKY